MSEIPPEPSSDFSAAAAAPPPLPYVSPSTPRAPVPGKTAKLIAGLTIGVILSAITWFTLFGRDSNQPLATAMLVLLGSKYVAALTLVWFRDWRPLSIGIFLSVPIGAVIFFSACAANFKI
ncbi:hypothetical protein BH09PLA1_BH09PLA1_05090 [soil metagenome]